MHVLRIRTKFQHLFLSCRGEITFETTLYLFIFTHPNIPSPKATDTTNGCSNTKQFISKWNYAYEAKYTNSTNSSCINICLHNWFQIPAPKWCATKINKPSYYFDVVTAPNNSDIDLKISKLIFSCTKLSAQNNSSKLHWNLYRILKICTVDCVQGAMLVCFFVHFSVQKVDFSLYS